MKSLPQRLPDNGIPFTIDGWRVDGLPREMLLRLRKLADRKGSTVADELHDGMAQWLAKREAESKLPAKIIQFPRQLLTSRKIGHDTNSGPAKINAALI